VDGRNNIAVPAVKVVEVDFQFRPNFLVDFVLEGAIPRQGMPDDRLVSGGQAGREPPGFYQ
jgi:hypothetical protein